jgi:predicted ATP-dependent endonuclease of OLD family
VIGDLFHENHRNKHKNFRSLYNTGWFPLHELSILIGHNDGGKTSAIEALELFLTNNKPLDEDFIPSSIADFSFPRLSSRYSCLNASIGNSEITILAAPF